MTRVNVRALSVSSLMAFAKAEQRHVSRRVPSFVIAAGHRGPCDIFPAFVRRTLCTSTEVAEQASSAASAKSMNGEASKIPRDPTKVKRDRQGRTLKQKRTSVGPDRGTPGTPGGIYTIKPIPNSESTDSEVNFMGKTELRDPTSVDSIDQWFKFAAAEGDVRTALSLGRIWLKRLSVSGGVPRGNQRLSLTHRNAICEAYARTGDMRAVKKILAEMKPSEKSSPASQACLLIATLRSETVTDSKLMDLLRKHSRNSERWLAPFYKKLFTERVQVKDATRVCLVLKEALKVNKGILTSITEEVLAKALRMLIRAREFDLVESVIEELFVAQPRTRSHLFFDLVADYSAVQEAERGQKFAERLLENRQSQRGIAASKLLRNVRQFAEACEAFRQGNLNRGSKLVQDVINTTSDRKQVASVYNIPVRILVEVVQERLKQGGDGELRSLYSELVTHAGRAKQCRDGVIALFRAVLGLESPAVNEKAQILFRELSTDRTGLLNRVLIERLVRECLAAGEVDIAKDVVKLGLQEKLIVDRQPYLLVIEESFKQAKIDEGLALWYEMLEEKSLRDRKEGPKVLLSADVLQRVNPLTVVKIMRRYRELEKKGKIPSQLGSASSSTNVSSTRHGQPEQAVRGESEIVTPRGKVDSAARIDTADNLHHRDDGVALEEVSPTTNHNAVSAESDPFGAHPSPDALVKESSKEGNEALEQSIVYQLINQERESREQHQLRLEEELESLRRQLSELEIVQKAHLDQLRVLDNRRGAASDKAEAAIAESERTPDIGTSRSPADNAANHAQSNLGYKPTQETTIASRQSAAVRSSDIQKGPTSKITNPILYWNSRLELCVAAADLKETEAILQRMAEDQINLNARSYGLLLQIYCTAGEVERAEKVLLWMVRHEFAPSQKDVGVMVRAYCAAGEMEKAEKLLLARFDVLLEGPTLRNVAKGTSDTTSLDSEGRSPLPVFSAALSLEQAEAALQSPSGALPKFDVFTQVIGYRVSAGQLEGAEACLDRLENVGARAIAETYLNEEEGWSMATGPYNRLIRAYRMVGMMDKAEAIAERMQRQNIELDTESFTQLLRGYCSMGDVGGAESILQRMRRAGLRPSIAQYNCLLQVYSHAGDINNVQDVIQEIKEIGLEPSESTYTLCARAYHKAGDPLTDSEVSQLFVA